MNRPEERSFDFKSGWLLKRGKLNTGWKRRFCTLTFDNKLEYWLEEKRINKRGSISIGKLKCRAGKFLISSKRITQPEEEERRFCLQTTSPNREWEFLAESKQDRKDWVQAINVMYESTAESVNQEYLDIMLGVDESKESTPVPLNLNDIELDVYIVTDDEELSEGTLQIEDPLTKLRSAIIDQHGGDALFWTILSLGENVTPEALFLEFYRGQERPNWNSRFGGYWEDILTTLINAKIDPDCVVEDRTFFHILAKDHHLRVLNALWSLGPSVGKTDARNLTVLDYFIRTSTSFITRQILWWETYQAIVRYGYTSSSIERSFRNLRYQLEQKNLANPELLANVNKAEAFHGKWERDIRKLILEIPSGFPITDKMGVNQIILCFCYGDIIKSSLESPVTLF